LELFRDGFEPPTFEASASSNDRAKTPKERGERPVLKIECGSWRKWGILKALRFAVMTWRESSAKAPL